MMILLTGGSACGKSTFAEQIVSRSPLPRVYVATMRPFDEECHAKIARHRAMRAEKHFETVEKYTNLSEVEIEPGSTVLLECLCNLTANEMFDADGSGKRAKEAVLSGIEHLRGAAGALIVVTNDVGSGGSDHAGETLEYVRLLGEINAEAARRSDVVIEMVCGIPVYLKRENAALREN